MEPEAQTVPTPANGLNLHHSHEAAFVRPSDLLRPRAQSRPITPAPPPPPKPEKPIDRDEREALVSRSSLSRGSTAGYKQQRNQRVEHHSNPFLCYNLYSCQNTERLTAFIAVTEIDTRVPQAPHLLRCPTPQLPTDQSRYLFDGTREPKHTGYERYGFEDGGSKPCRN